ncbi:hypothetical protein DKL61_13545 [Gammaproteobacteria bacterium ESL0073]|nr:hypothetical protein DKL61_13545 [Gammaproteobacteria bacterium ESL0073]
MTIGLNTKYKLGINMHIYELNGKKYKIPTEKVSDFLIANPNAKWIFEPVKVLFEQQVIQKPDSMALADDEQKLTYQELNARVNQLAHYLITHYHLQADDLVAVVLDRTVNTVIAMLAVLKAGGAYVPIDPSVPDERISYILGDAKPRVVLTQGHYVQKLSQLDNSLLIKAIDDETFITELKNYSTENPSVNITAHQLAYVIYTSGTTGNPKGVMVEQGNMVGFLSAVNRLYKTIWHDPLNRPKHYLWYANYVFDSHIYEVYPCLITGATLFVVSGDTRYDLSLLKQYIERNHIEAACIPPVLLDKDDLLPLTLLTVAGDTTNQEIIDSYLDHQVNVLNAYGPTECSVCTNINLYKKGDKNTNIGPVLSGYKVYVVSEKMQQLPDGAIGELCAAGVGVTRGYLNNPQLTAERFPINPFQTDTEKKLAINERIYRTGDLVRKLPDGRFEYFGRNDCQVKIRGYRIELGEIEARLAAYKAIKKAAVLAKEHSSGMLYLAAYYVSEQTYEQEELANYLAEFLPDYMIPSAYVRMEQFPMNVSGKLDRKVLPEPTVTLEQYKAPENELEEQLQACFAKVLGVDTTEISVEGNFFRLGGNSILAIKLIDHINHTLKTNINIAAAFTYNTVRKFANNFDALQGSSVVISSQPVESVEAQLLSFAQERLKFIDLYEGKSKAYNIPLIFKLKKSIHIDHLLTAIKAVIHKHHVLRSLIKTNSQGVNYQVVQDDIENPVLIDVKTVHDQEALNTILGEQVDYLFDLENEYPIKISLLQQADDLYMAIVVHHIAFDGWSGDIFINDLLQAYDKLQEKGQVLLNEPNHFSTLLDPLAIQYKDFALWQQSYLSGEVLEKQLAFWKDQLAGYEALNLPTDKPRPSQVSYHGDTINFVLDESLSTALRNTAQTMDVSLFALLLSGYYLLLSTYSNQKDIVVGSPIANRNHKEIMDMIGFFVNSVALRQQINTEETLLDFVKKVGHLTNDVQQYQDLPFEHLVDALKVKKDTSRHPIFQVMFSVQSFGHEQQQRLNEFLESYGEELGQDVAKFDLTTMLDDNGVQIKGFFNYATSLFNKETIESFITSYQLILNELVSSLAASKKIKELSLLNTQDYQKIIYDWNKTTPVFSDTTVVSLFNEQVKRTPNHIAAVFDDRRLTYKELDSIANQLAHYLKETYAIQPDDIVALALSRSMETVITILAVLKAGAAYVPMVPEAPKERVSYIVKDTDAKVLLTNQAHQANFTYVEQSLGVRVEAIDDQAFVSQKLAQYPTTSPVTALTPQNLAYIIYTSGTTGNPKGVMVEHHNVAHLFIGAEQLYHFNEQDVWTLFHSYVFDFSVWELWGSLLFGGRLVIPNQEQSYDIGLFYRLCLKEQVTILNQTPSVFYQFIESAIGQGVKIDALRYVIFGGEPLNVAQLKPWYTLYADNAPYLVNMYGITETTVFATYPDALTVKDLDKLPLIGRVLNGYTGYVLNSERIPLPIGAVGELYLGGDGVTRGYLNNLELTADRFIDNPFQSDEEKEKGINGRLYKSGDLVRYAQDGQLEYIGRNDFQVKIRGFRIELEEIATRLSNYPEIKQSVVLTKENHLNEKYIVAYYVCDHEINRHDIVSYLSSYLPSYMIPSYFIQLTKLPVTINGKLDRHQLPEPSFVAKNYVAPETPIEKVICELVASFLDLAVNDVGTTDNYFELGGNSITATRLIYEINTQFNAKLKIVDLFMLPTLGDLAKFVEEAKQAYQAVVALNGSEASTYLIMVHPGGGGCEAYLPIARAVQECYRCYGVEPYNIYHDQKIDNLHVLAELYLRNIESTLPKQSTYHLLGWSLGGLLALEMASILESKGVTDIKVYLLDTILIGSAEQDKVAPPTDERIKEMIKDYTGLDFEAAKAVLLTENKLINQQVSTSLNSTEIVLFRATLSNREKHEAVEKRYTQMLTNQAQLTIVNLDHSSHDDLLEQEPTVIIDKLLQDARAL